VPTLAVRRLPGLSFVVRPPAPAEVLPRMDVAVFVGFAASGPLHVPVAVEDPAHFADVFGADAPLAWDPLRGEAVSAYLAPAVRAFFANGGRRCWVVRVADAVDSRALKIPFVRQVGDGGEWQEVYGRARSQGSWADALTLLTALENEALAAPGWDLDPGAALGFLLTMIAHDGVAPGDLLRLTFPSLKPVMLLAVEETEDHGGGTGVTAGTAVWVDADQALTTAPVLPAEPPSVERLTFELRVRRGDEVVWRLDGLGFVPGHPRYWADLPIDEELYGATEQDVTPLWTAAAEPRFPVAGPADDRPVCFPYKMDFVPNGEDDVGPLPETALQRDGLAVFTSDLFLDPALTDADTAALPALADTIRFGEGRALRGIHAALDLDETTLIVVPDAVHRGWFPDDPPQPPPPIDTVPLPVLDDGAFLVCDLTTPAAPSLRAVAETSTGQYTVSWDSDAPAPGARFFLQEAAAPDFSDAADVYEGDGHNLDFYGHRPGNYYYRVRVEVGGVSSDWSKGIVVQVMPRSAWRLNDPDPLPQASLLAVQRALLRLCAARGDLLAVLSLPEHYRDDNALAHAGELRRLGDLGAGIDALGVPPLGYGEVDSLSYGALYHPWLIGREDTGDLRRSPPDGASCGILALRALARGAWVAPANEPLTDVVALDRPAARDNLADLQEAQVNVVRQEPQGFLCLAADTLSLDDELRPINVRRLLMLLRRLALRLGPTYVFEPDGDALRRMVQRGFESALGYLFERGAFAGGTAETSFQVVAGTGPTAAADAELGRFVVELRVAPSRPLTFLTVRLVQTGDSGQVTEGS
jgi:hypothetical protein